MSPSDVRPTDAEAAARYAEVIRLCQERLAEWVADHDSKISARDTGNALLAIMDHRDLVGFQLARGDITLDDPDSVELQNGEVGVAVVEPSYDTPTVLV